MKTRSIVFFVIIFYLYSFNLQAQCTVGMPIPIASDLTCPVQPNGTVNPVPSNGTSYLNTPGNYTVSFGNTASKLFICSTGVSLTFFGGPGNTIVEAGAGVIYINNSINHFLTNYGNVTFPGLSLGVSSSIYNDTYGVINYSGGPLNVNNMVYNKGIMTNVGLYSTGVGGYMCLGDQSILSVQSIFNNVVNSFTTESTTAAGCISLATTFNANGQLSTSSNVGVCAGSSSTDVAAPTYYGSAKKYTNCTGCVTALPISSINLTIASTYIKWKTWGSDRVDKFQIQQSIDGEPFETIHTLIPTKLSNEYQWNGFLPKSGKWYYRIEAQLANGESIYSDIQSFGKSSDSAEIQIMPNPVKNILKISFQSNSIAKGSIEILDILGKSYGSQEVFIAPNTWLELDFTAFPSGAYVLQWISEGNVVREVVVKE